MSKKKNLGPLGCLFALLYFPIGVILELSKNYSGKRRR